MSSMKIILPFVLALVFVSCGNADKTISEQLDQQLMAGNPNVRATVKDGVVTLTGTCPDLSCKNVCETAAREVEGVKQVINEIQVAEPVDITQQQIDSSGLQIDSAKTR